MSGTFWESQALWVFIGIVAGALIQFLLGQLQFWMFRRNAKKLFRVETEINRSELSKLKLDIERKKQRFVANQQTSDDYFFDLSDFNYRIIDPLINSGQFHAILGPEAVANYFRFLNALRSDRAVNWQNALRQQHEHGKSLQFFDWLLETKMKEWEGFLSTVEDRLR